MLSILRRIQIRLGWIPRGTTVEATLFPEDEYPVVCLNCGYDLRELPDGRCPECGTSFARGHLLVEVYARGRRPRTDARRRNAKRLIVLAWAGWITPFLVFFGFGILLRIVPVTTAANIFVDYYKGVFLTCFVSLAIALLAILISTPLYWAGLPRRSKRLAVWRAATEVSSRLPDVLVTRQS